MGLLNNILAGTISGIISGVVTAIIVNHLIKKSYLSNIIRIETCSSFPTLILMLCTTVGVFTNSGAY